LFTIHNIVCHCCTAIQIKQEVSEAFSTTDPRFHRELRENYLHNLAINDPQTYAQYNNMLSMMQQGNANNPLVTTTTNRY
jgi:hypothetical protein